MQHIVLEKNGTHTQLEKGVKKQRKNTSVNMAPKMLSQSKFV